MNSKIIGFYSDLYWGEVRAEATKYADQSLAVLLTYEGGLLANLSTNIPSAGRLPPDCFYGKNWNENQEIFREAMKSGLFILRADLPAGKSGFVSAPVVQIKWPNPPVKG